jgi:hypothetical protein
LVVARGSERKESYRTATVRESVLFRFFNHNNASSMHFRPH